MPGKTPPKRAPRLSRSKRFMKQAETILPAGVNSPVRAFGAVGGTPRFIEKAKGAILTDVDGNSYIDYVCSWGPLILGHAHPEVVSAVRQAATRGTSYGAPHPGEVRLAKIVAKRMPWIEQLRFVNSGTEASMSALRLARAATGRNRILKFEGNYHGHVDSMLVKAGSGLATFGLPDSSGVPEAMTRDSLVAPYNHLDRVEQLFQEQGDAIAAVIVEPVAGNMGVIPPVKGFLAGLRKLTSRHGSILIFDEVITGFRVSSGGAAGLYGIHPDLVCLGKIIGGGLPVGAYGGKARLMKMVAPLGPVYQAGTLSGNPLAMAAGLATLENLTPSLYASLEKSGRLLEAGLLERLSRHGLPAQVNRVGSLLSVFFTDRPVTDPETAFSTNRDFYARLFHSLLRNGVYLPPSSLEAWFVSAAHQEKVIERTLRSFDKALEETLKERAYG